MAYLYYILLGVKHRHRHYNSSSPIITYHSIMQYRIDWNNVADSAGAHSGSYGCSHCCCDLKGCKSIWDGKVQAKGLRVGISTWTLAIFPGSMAGGGARMIRKRGHTLQPRHKKSDIAHIGQLQVCTCGFCVVILMMLVSRCTSMSTRDFSSCSSSPGEPTNGKRGEGKATQRVQLHIYMAYITKFLQGKKSNNNKICTLFIV